MQIIPIIFTIVIITFILSPLYLFPYNLFVVVFMFIPAYIILLTFQSLKRILLRTNKNQLAWDIQIVIITTLTSTYFYLLIYFFQRINLYSRLHPIPFGSILVPYPILLTLYLYLLLLWKNFYQFKNIEFFKINLPFYRKFHLFTLLHIILVYLSFLIFTYIWLVYENKLLTE